MTQVCETATAVSITRTTPLTTRSIGDRVLAAQLTELETTSACHLAELQAALVLAISLHHEAVESGAPPEHGLARLRELGSRWAISRCPLDPLLSMLRDLTAKVAHAVASGGGDVALTTRVRSNGVRFAREVLTGFQQGYDPCLDHRGKDCAQLDRQLLASNLLWGNELSLELRAMAEDGYTVVAVHWPGLAADEAITLLHNAFQACGADGMLSLLANDDCYVLVPAHDERQALGLCRQVHDLLSGDLWFAVSWQALPEVSAGRQEAHSVLALARGREPGVYQLDDVLVEYAVMQDSAAVGCLVDLITPVLRQETLLTTLEVLIGTNGNRSKATTLLNVHRSTLDHRLGRIEQLTGCRPSTGRGVQMLSTAITTYKTLHGNMIPAGGN